MPAVVTFDRFLLCFSLKTLRYLFKFYYFSLFESQTEMQSQRGRSSIHWLTPQRPTTARSGPDRSQEPRTQSSSPTWVSDTQPPGHPQLPLTKHISRKPELEVELGFKPRCSRRDAGVPTVVSQHLLPTWISLSSGSFPEVWVDSTSICWAWPMCQLFGSRCGYARSMWRLIWD